MSAVLSVVAPAGAAAQEHAAEYERYAVASDHAAASAAGAEVLAAGGSAADAAAATMLALGVASPASSGLGGGGFALYYRAEDRSIVFIDFRERAPMASTSDMFVREEGGEAPVSQPSQVGGLASGVPGEMAGIEELLRRFGRLPREQVVAPAIRLAEEGVAVTPYLAMQSEGMGEAMRADRELATFFEGDATVLREGQLLKRPRLARTLRAIARGGARAFYHGSIAREIVAANRRTGGMMTLADLAAYGVTEREPLDAERLGHRFVTAPPPSAGGFTLLSSLALFERILPDPRRASPALLLHAFAESWKGPFLDRQRYFGDPDHLALPLDALLDPARLAARAAVFHPTLAMPPSDYAFPLAATSPAAAAVTDGGTSHLCVVDADGNVAAVSTTINLYFGARYTAAGFPMNDQMDDFARSVGEENAFGLPGGMPNLPGPGHRPVSTMTPTLVFDDEGPILCIGGSGGSRIVTAVEQVVLRILLLGEEPGEAIARPRVHHQGGAVLMSEVDAPLPADILQALRARGHAIQMVPHLSVIQAIRIRREGGARRLLAASDPRKGGRPAGQ